MNPPASPTARAADILRSGARALTVELSPEAIDTLERLLDELWRWNQAYNLTAIRDPAEMLTRHVLDSLAALPELPAGATRLIDIGSGAGFPGLALAIAQPSLQVAVLDSSGKKARFMRHAVRTLKITNAEVIEARCEDHQPATPYDVVISRAFAALGDFLRLTGHLAGPSGKWLAMKGKLDAQEQNSLPEGFQIVDVKPLTVPGLNEVRHLIIAARS